MLWSNLLLAAGKLIIGFMISSRAVMLDGLNSLSDMITSVVTMISTLYAGKRSDREHPFGYGRLEYITSMFTTVFIGNESTRIVGGKMVTPRGYRHE